MSIHLLTTLICVHICFIRMSWIMVGVVGSWPLSPVDMQLVDLVSLTVLEQRRGRRNL